MNLCAVNICQMKDEQKRRCIHVIMQSHIKETLPFYHFNESFMRSLVNSIQILLTGCFTVYYWCVHLPQTRYALLSSTSSQVQNSPNWPPKASEEKPWSLCPLFFIFLQMTALKKLWKMLISSEKLI